jgi:hypothetical protein
VKKMLRINELLIFLQRVKEIGEEKRGGGREM